ncbi:tRNA-dihydrouridine synthase A [Advenella kashmirensis WT001]|uniref:tRNA-dihydrouridine synthase A n=1 Tax=Advenella kashmirensis (strain DSM 17095 / LMG 22695 / WT001) TaxID=1036672 RepID=I3UD65_ADVKW|nr:tRNA-dihydrouridine synthase A [Advenella kashmirensis WT001]
MIMTHTEITERVAATGPGTCGDTADIHAVAVAGASPAGSAVLDYSDKAGLRPWQFSVAPMIDVTDRHCRYFHRLLAPNALLYTEMITTGAWFLAMCQDICALALRNTRLLCNWAAASRRRLPIAPDWGKAGDMMKSTSIAVAPQSGCKRGRSVPA